MTDFVYNILASLLAKQAYIIWKVTDTLFSYITHQSLRFLLSNYNQLNLKLKNMEIAREEKKD